MVWRRRSETPHPHKSRDRGPDSRPPHVRRGPGTHQDSASQRLGRYHHPRPVFHGGHPADLGCHCLLFFIHWLESAICLAWAIVNLLGLLARERTRIEMWAPRGFKKHILPKELKPDGPLLRWTWFEGTEVSKKGWIMALIVLLNLFLKRIFPLFPLKLFLWKKEWNYSLSILKKKKKSKSSGEKPSCLGWEWPGRKWSRHSVISTCPAFIPFLQLHSIFRRKSPPSHSVCMVQKGLKVYTVSRNGGWSIRPVYPFGNSSWAKDGYMNYANPIQLKPVILLKRVRKVTLLWEWS